MLPVGSTHHNVVCHRMAFADLGLRSSGLGIPGAAPDLGTGARALARVTDGSFASTGRMVGPLEIDEHKEEDTHLANN